MSFSLVYHLRLSYRLRLLLGVYEDLEGRRVGLQALYKYLHLKCLQPNPHPPGTGLNRPSDDLLRMSIC